MDGIVGCVKRRPAAAASKGTFEHEYLGKVESLWRYPIKSMAGEALAEAFFGYAGVYGDRAYAFLHSAGPPGFPYLTGRERREMLLYRPRFSNAAVAAMPPNHAAAQELAELSAVYPEMSELEVEVATPSGQVLAADDPALLAMLAGDQPPPGLSLTRSHRAMTDARPVSLISTETIRQLGDEVSIRSTSGGSAPTSMRSSAPQRVSARLPLSGGGCRSGAASSSPCLIRTRGAR